jgi:hypothetical protein
MAGFLAQHSDLCQAGRDEGIDPLKATALKDFKLSQKKKGR